jgi:hypothetical protein
MKTLIRGIAILALCAGFVPASFAQPSRAALERLVAPVAQYPDELLTQVMVASTYPQDVVEASRWLRSNPGLSGERAVQLATSSRWDSSVESLAANPHILHWMEDNIRWTEEMGAAFIAYEPYVWDAVQAQRHRAWAAGTLRSTPQRVVTHGPVIVIRPVRPHVVHVPFRVDWPRREVIVVRPHQPPRVWRHDHQHRKIVVHERHEPRRAVVHREVRRPEVRREQNEHRGRASTGGNRDRDRNSHGHRKHDHEKKSGRG